MNICLGIIIAFILGCSMLFCGFDALLYFITCIKRYHIGIWDDYENWIDAVQMTSYRWLRKTPIIKKTDNSRYVLLDILQGKYKSDTVQCWQVAALVLGVNEVNSIESKKRISLWRDSIITPTGRWKNVIRKIDFATMGYVLSKVSNDREYIKPAMEEVIDIIQENICSDGMISYSQGKTSCIRFVDTLGMVCPFLTRFGVIYERPEFVSMAFEQISSYHQFGMFEGTTLPCHAYTTNGFIPLGGYGWGRGTAWYFLALLNTWKEMNNCKEREIIKTWIRESAEDYIKYQQDDGGYCTILQGGGLYDSSVTAAMAYFYKCCALIFDERKYLELSNRCLVKIKSVTMKNGAIDMCQGDTHGIGNFSKVFDIMPFAQGLVLQTIYTKVEDLNE